MPKPKLKRLEKKEVDLNLIVPEHTRLATIQGGKNPPGYDWLTNLPEGTQFIVRAVKPIGNQMPSPFMLQMGEVSLIMKKARIIRMVQGEHSAEMIVDPKGFCETFELIESTDEPTED